MKYLKLYEDFNLSDIPDMSELINKLKEYKLPIEQWGTGESKTIEHLWNELTTKECSIVDEGGYLVRYVEFVGVDVFYKDKKGDIYILQEDRQEFKDGRVRKRDMISSVSEKMKSGEDPLESALRGVEEEIGISLSSSDLTPLRNISKNAGSQSYPGLTSKYNGYKFTCFINDEQFKPDGYVEVQKDKSTFFKWQKKEK